MPHPERREASGTLNAVNAEVALDLNGDNSATVYLNAPSAWTGTYVVEVSPDGTNYYAALAWPYTPGCINGTIPVAGQPLTLEASTLAIQRVLCVAVGGMKKIRVRASAWTSGSLPTQIVSDVTDSISPYVRDQRAGTLLVTVTGAVSATITVTLPAVTGLRHYVDFIKVTRSATAALTPSATPVVVTTTNLPGSPAFTFGSDAGGVGLDIEREIGYGSSGGAAAGISTATTVVAPSYTGVIWRITVAYRLGL
jgi:hypothetical protein